MTLSTLQRSISFEWIRGNDWAQSDSAYLIIADLMEDPWISDLARSMIMLNESGLSVYILSLVHILISNSIYYLHDGVCRVRGRFRLIHYLNGSFPFYITLSKLSRTQ
jgi:hypothetical protein